MDVDAPYTLDPASAYWYTKGYNSNAIVATGVAAVVAMAPVVLGPLARPGPERGVTVC